MYKFEVVTNLLQQYWKYMLMLFVIVLFITIYSSLGDSYEPIKIGEVYLKNNYDFREDLGFIRGISSVTFHTNENRISIKDSLYARIYFHVRGSKKSKYVEMEFERASTSEDWEILNTKVLD